MLREVLAHLGLKPGMIVLDATIGCGGHAQKILERILPDGFLVGVDWDSDAIKEAERKLACYKGHFKLFCDNFANIDNILSALQIKKLDGCLFDLGVSSLQLENPGRGFSIKHDGKLDMRMNKEAAAVSAFELVNRLPEHELAAILKRFGEERFARSIARNIVRKREKEEISTTWQLAAVAIASVPARFRNRKIHPATRTFLALRLAVNRELDNLECILKKLPPYLKKGARVCVISFHSLEDRIVKNLFRQYSSEKIANVITKKVLVPLAEEISSNPRARSAKFRIAEKI